MNARKAKAKQALLHRKRACSGFQGRGGAFFKAAFNRFFLKVSSFPRVPRVPRNPRDSRKTTPFFHRRNRSTYKSSTPTW